MILLETARKQENESHLLKVRFKQYANNHEKIPTWLIHKDIGWNVNTENSAGIFRVESALPDGEHLQKQWLYVMPCSGLKRECFGKGMIRVQNRKVYF